MAIGYHPGYRKGEAERRKDQVATKACATAIKGRVKYCRYIIGEEITCEQVERLYHFLHANYDAIEFIQLRDDELHRIAEENKEEWQ